MSNIDKKLVDRLLELSRFELGSGEEKSLLQDFNNIVGYFKKLEDVDVGGVGSAIGGSLNKNEKRNDSSEENRLDPGLVKDDFPKKEGGYNKVPSVFE